MNPEAPVGRAKSANPSVAAKKKFSLTRGFFRFCRANIDDIPNFNPVEFYGIKKQLASKVLFQPHQIILPADFKINLNCMVDKLGKIV